VATSIVTIGLVAAPVFHPECAYPQIFGFPAQETTQWLNHAELVLGDLRMAQQIYNQVQMIRMMTREGLSLAMVPNLAGMIMGDLTGIRNIIRQSQGLSYGLAANDQLFRQTYSSYGVGLGMPYSSQYQNWSTMTLNMAAMLAKVAGAQQDQVMGEQPLNAQMQSLLATPQGTDQAIELTNVLSGQMVNQMQNLRTMMAADMQSKASFMAYQISKDQAVQASADIANAYVHRDVDHSQYGNVPGQP
jgi:P-type conjugative transfer protein TrbJ